MASEKANHTLEGKLVTLDKLLCHINQRIIHYFDSTTYCNDDPELPAVVRLEDNVQRLILRASALERELSISRTLAADERRKLFESMRITDTGQDLKRGYQESLEVIQVGLKDMCLNTERTKLLFDMEAPEVEEVIRSDINTYQEGLYASDGSTNGSRNLRQQDVIARASTTSWEDYLRLSQHNLNCICDAVQDTKDKINSLEHNIGSLETEIERLNTRQSAFDALLSPATSPGQRTRSKSSGKGKVLPPVRHKSTAGSSMRSPPSQPLSSPASDTMIKTSDLLVSQSADKLHYHKLKGRQRKRKSPHTGSTPHYSLPELFAHAQSGERKLTYPSEFSFRQMELLAKQIGVAVSIQKPHSEYFQDDKR